MPPGLRCAVRKRKNLTPAEIAEIIHKVVVRHQLQKDVAREHRLKPVLVCRLAMKAKKSPHYIGEILRARDDTAAHREAIAEAVAQQERRKTSFVKSEIESWIAVLLARCNAQAVRQRVAVSQRRRGGCAVLAHLRQAPLEDMI